MRIYCRSRKIVQTSSIYLHKSGSIQSRTSGGGTQILLFADPQISKFEQHISESLFTSQTLNLVRIWCSSSFENLSRFESNKAIKVDLVVDCYLAVSNARKRQKCSDHSGEFYTTRRDLSVCQRTRRKDVHVRLSSWSAWQTPQSVHRIWAVAMHLQHLLLVVQLMSNVKEYLAPPLIWN